ncbi:MAG: aldehyde dehydrogenase family protein, partial [Limnobacter sp.]|nr:aldehyde dehydrogenase family protein [Limnobacter sp.]
MNAPTKELNQELTAADLKASLGTLQKAYESDPYPTWGQRHAWLKSLSQAIYDNKMRIADAISADFGYRSPNDTLLAEVFPTLEGIRHALKHGKGWMKPRKAHTGIWFKPAKSELMPQPLGVIGVMVPFNYPLLLSMGPLTNAITAGNRTFIKMSEHAPRLTQLLNEILTKALGRDMVQIIDGEANVAAAFSALPFNHLVFTGSTQIGKLVMKAASENL